MNQRLSRIHDWETLARDAKYQPGTMAALCPISLRQLQRFFLLHFNRTPGCWLRELRGHQARELISHGWSNRAVATELGFSNESHLCHEFKRLFGVPPQTFSPLYAAPAATERHLQPLPLSLFNKNVAFQQGPGVAVPPPQLRVAPNSTCTTRPRF
jgi:AraC-like DNA-binding protein